jgi:ABC-type multidrug transport system fused ATPase/permease subunit
MYLRLLSFLKPYRLQVFGVILVIGAAASFTMVTPKLLQWAVDTGLKPSSATDLTADAPAGATALTVRDAINLVPDQSLIIGGRRNPETVIIKSAAENTLALTAPTTKSHFKNDRVSPEKQTFAGKTNTLVLAGALIIGAAALRGFFTYWQTFMGEWLGQHVAFDLRNRIYEKLQRLSYAYHDRQQTGQLMSRATQDVEATRMYIQMAALRLFDIALRVTIAIVLMFLTDWRLALVAWCLLPLIGIRSAQVQVRMRRIWTRVQEQLGRTTTVLQENLIGVRVVKAFSRQKTEEAKFNKEAEELFTWNYAQNRLQASNTPLYTAVGMLSQVAVVWIGAIFITQNTLTPGQLVGFISYLTLLLLPMRQIGFIVSQFSRAGAAGERIFEILDAESAVREKPEAIDLKSVAGHVRFENVSFGYDAIASVLSDVDIDAEPGKIVALLGPTGSGKTTVVNLMPRFYDVTGGAITIDGIDVRDVTLVSLRRNIGIIQQDVFLFSATIHDNIAYGAVEATDEQVIEAAKIARIHDYIMSLPEGYETWVGERGITLSGGQKQRLSIARTLLLDPRILILDDSTSSVDTQTEYLIQQALQAVMQNRTTFVIAQRLRTVKDADQILVMRDGRIVERGTHAELIELDGQYREIYDLELRDQEEALQNMETARQTAAGQTEAS